MNTRSELATLLKVFSNFLTELTDTEYEELLNGNGKLLYRSKDNEKNKNKKLHSKNDNIYLNDIIKKLDVLDDRSEAEMIIIQSNLKKSDLIQLSTYFNIYVSSSISKERIIEKIVEETVGARVRSQAIKDTKIKNKNQENYY
ncbi:hypothetical protein [Paenibacillus sp. KS-LC4]|uniref:hypothetical protein n=1 Tax=Paenibacillus sp. KS-LC4 TaxID=2979727 RepID=UPI0030CE6A91